MIGNQKYITIATDAGLWREWQIAVWAAYIVAPGGVLQVCHPFKQFVDSSHLAETMALRNALHIVDQQFNLAEYKIIIYGEVEHVLRPITTKAGNIRKNDMERSSIIGQMQHILSKSAGWEWRHVKAHTSPAKARKQNGGDLPAKYKLNRWCDMECRRVGRTLVREAKAKLAASQQSEETQEGV